MAAVGNAMMSSRPGNFIQAPCMPSPSSALFPIALIGASMLAVRGYRNRDPALDRGDLSAAVLCRARPFQARRRRLAAVRLAIAFACVAINLKPVFSPPAGDPLDEARPN